MQVEVEVEVEVGVGNLRTFSMSRQLTRFSKRFHISLNENLE